MVSGKLVLDPLTRLALNAACAYIAGDPDCTLASSNCEFACSNPSDWTKWGAVANSGNVGEDVCFSEDTVVKAREKSPLDGSKCIEKGQFCK